MRIPWMGKRQPQGPAERGLCEKRRLQALCSITLYSQQHTQFWHRS
uniref:Uncharacterized protein n=1 Tax=Rhizophora mucronata TaxID=61149 RepID=A0A2P2NVT0_RHIMU